MPITVFAPDAYLHEEQKECKNERFIAIDALPEELYDVSRFLSVDSLRMHLSRVDNAEHIAASYAVSFITNIEDCDIDIFPFDLVAEPYYKSIIDVNGDVYRDALMNCMQLRKQQLKG